MKKVSSYLLATIMMFSVSGSVLAAPITSKDSKADINFKEIDENESHKPEIDNPVDPGDDKPVTPEDPAEEVKGPLTIDHISKFKFGEVLVSGNTQKYDVELTSVTDSQGEVKQSPNYIQVSDNRGKHLGWTLKVKQTKAFSAGTSELTGASITLNHLKATKLNTNQATSPVVNPTAVEVTGEASEVASAAIKTGMGTHTILAGDIEAETAGKAIQLTVPGDIEKEVDKTYTGTLTWELTSDGSN